MLLFFMLSRTVDRTTQATRDGVWVRSRSKRVDLLIATYNEEEAILERTIIGAQSQDYDNYRFFVLDDGRRDWLRDLCQRRKVGYIARSNNEHAKAGNINNALRRLANEEPGEFVAILDADFVLQPEFLSRALAPFRDEEVGCVQTPQHFFNPDPLQHGFGAASTWPDEQRFFFDVLLASKDAWGVAFCCGTSSITRREALEQVGGFPTESVTEDMLLSLKLKEAGWKTVYLNERLSMGLAPEAVSEYITQRGRWCLGFMQIARSRWGVLGSATLPALDRISLFDAFLYRGASFPFRVLCLIAPIMYGLTGLAVINADAQDVLNHYVPSICTPVIVLAWITRGRVMPIVTDAAQLLVCVDAMKAAAFGLIKPKGHKFKVTAKGGERDRLNVQWRLIVRFLLPLLLATIGAVAYGTFDVFSPAYGNRNAPVWLFWSYYNTISDDFHLHRTAAAEDRRLPRRRAGAVDDRPAHTPASGAAAFDLMGNVERHRADPARSRHRPAVAQRQWTAKRTRVENRQQEFRGDLRNDAYASRGDRTQAVFGPVPAQARAVPLCRRDHCDRRKARLVTSRKKAI
jgi:cellulose synthase (UDP-forming)